MQQYLDENIIEELRKNVINKLFDTMEEAWKIWSKIIFEKYISYPITSQQIIDLGDHLKEIINSTKKLKNDDEDDENPRNQRALSKSGSLWESLVCWYLNLCCIGRRTVIIKHNKKFIPIPISNAITVNYCNFTYNSESDLIAITFPDNEEYIINKNNIDITNERNKKIQLYKGKKYNLLEILNTLVARDMRSIEIHIIQCKTNWNDNAQIPMLWDMIYSLKDIKNNNITIGREGYSIKNIGRFTYSFVTVPTVKPEIIKPTSVCVLRVRNLSGGNYWGMPSREGVANSLKEMLNRILDNGSTMSHIESLNNIIPKLSTTYSYFKLYK